MTDRFSIAAKRGMRIIIRVILVQLFIACVFIALWSASKPIRAADIIQTEITVKDTFLFRAWSEYWLIVNSDAGKYVIPSRPTINSLSTSEIEKMISNGDRLQLSYCKRFTIIGKTNLVLSIASGDESYRSIKEYNSGSQGVSAVVIIFCAIIELVFCLIAAAYILLNKNAIIKLFKRR